MRAAYRVAAPSIRFVPLAALASCWPLPQQLLPVSATGGGRRRCTLRIFSGKIIFISRLSRSAERSKRYFHGRGRRGKRQLQRRFLRKRSAAGGRSLPPWGSCRAATEGSKLHPVCKLNLQLFCVLRRFSAILWQCKKLCVFCLTGGCLRAIMNT